MARQQGSQMSMMPLATQHQPTCPPTRRTSTRIGPSRQGTRPVHEPSIAPNPACPVRLSIEPSCTTHTPSPHLRQRLEQLGQVAAHVGVGAVPHVHVRHLRAGGKVIREQICARPRALCRGQAAWFACCPSACAMAGSAQPMPASTPCRSKKQQHRLKGSPSNSFSCRPPVQRR